MKKQLLTGALAVGTLTIVSLSQSNSAQAFSFNDSSVTISNSDDNQSFDVIFNGNVENKNITGLSSKANFTFNGGLSNGLCQG